MLRKYLIYISIIAVLLIASAMALVWIIKNLDPNQNSLYSLGAFYASTGILAFGIVAEIGFWLRRRFGSRELVQQQYRISVRQGALIAILTVSSLILQSFRLFGWVNISLLLFALIFLEFYFISNERKNF